MALPRCASIHLFSQAPHHNAGCVWAPAAPACMHRGGTRPPRPVLMVSMPAPVRANGARADIDNTGVRWSAPMHHARLLGRYG